MKKVLVTGGMGYIGSHTVVELIQAGYQPIIADNLSNSEASVLTRIETITGYLPAFYEVDVCDADLLNHVFAKEKTIDLVIHFAAYKSVNDSVQKPVIYFQNNLVSLLSLLECMQKNRVKNMVFSSSATVYGEPDSLPITEDTTFKKALSAYGSTKQMGEEILQKTAAAGSIKAIALRYFNPAGAHETALIGELPRGVPNNLMPFVTQTGVGKREKLIIFGNDYPTPDGTCIRDYIHVVDLARAHVASCKRLLTDSCDSFEVYNIGTGKGTSVLEIINTFERISGVKLASVFGVRRPGDAMSVYADAEKAKIYLGWEAKLTLEDMVFSAWKWEKTLIN